eukprot:CAMPEP_0174994726 /NCGR_PEP_ID=MMETSP0004_2-20121128/23792_1 /TAXON_ID=420556 /ORGANISM="Ochromonas sp., Strain CCMP1393" /LENGTH=252 /DNA_ID=CAMNT_0016248987 /DNA_START=183 /DNA_END=942 /DNA_ORIENTATION=-
MGGVFGKEKPLKDIVRENQRLIKKSIRELEKETRTLETNEKKLIADIKKHAKANQMAHLNAVSLKMQTVKSHDAMAQAMKGVTKALTAMNKKVKIMAKDLVRTRNYITRFIEMKTHLNAVSLKMQTVKSHDAMAQAMKGVTKALTAMNKKGQVPGLQKIMTEFMRENEKSEITSEMIGDTLDDAMEEEGSAEEEEMIVGQVLDELGINMSEATPAAPEGAIAAKEGDTKVEEKPAAEDPAISDLQARLQNLK